MDIDFDVKLKVTKNRIKEWYGHWNGNVYVAFSGGKDSTVLLHIVRSMYKNTPAVFCNTGLEFPQILQFVRSIENVTWLKPKMNFKEVLNKYGYPVISKEVSQKINECINTKSEKLRKYRLNGNGTKYKSGKIPEKWKFLIKAPFKISHKCCDVMKKRPSIKYEKESGNKPFIGTMMCNSHLRAQSVKRYGCNAFNMNRPQSRPLSLWNESDIWQYIKENDITYSKIYDMGYKNTGCTFCMFGCHIDNSKFELMERTHPKLYDYCMDDLGLNDIMKYLSSQHEELFSIQPQAHPTTKKNYDY